MGKDVALLFYYNEKHKYSLNALLGAIETKGLERKVDLFLETKKEEFLNKALELANFYERIVIPISFFTTEIWAIEPFIKEIKNTLRGKNYLLVAGGPHPTGDPIGTLRMDFDLVFVGEGEVSFVEFVEKLNQGEDFSKVRGIYAKYPDNTFCFTRKHPLIDLNEYSPFSFLFNKFGPIEITRGCPFGCFYCQTPRIFGAKPRHRSIERILEYVRFFKSRNLTDIRFITPNFFAYGSETGRDINYEALEELLRKIRITLGEKGRIFAGTFPSEVRPEHVNPITLSLLKKYANNNTIVIGLQSGSERILKLINRGHTVEEGIKAVKYAVEFGFKPKVDFIFGLPDETEEDQIITIEIMKKLVEIGAEIHAHSFLPLPQTPFAGKRPTRVIEPLKKFLSQHSAKGMVTGSWQRQEKLGIKIAEYFEKTSSLNPLYKTRDDCPRN